MKGLDQCCAGIRISHRYQPAINLHTYPHTRAGVKFFKTGFSIEPQFSKKLKNSRTHVSNCWFFAGSFMKTGGSLMLVKYP
jgi:hypothetical protein